jgi:hypothetical protein
MLETIFHEIDEDFWCETLYIKNIIKELEKHLDNISIIITPNINNLPNTKFKKVVILIGDELGRLGLSPYSNLDVLCVFRTFNHKNRYDDKYIYPIPIGYNWTMHSDRSKKMKQFYPNKLIGDREIDIFFSGNITSNFSRNIMINNLEPLKKHYNIFSYITNTFRTGIEIDQYYKYLGNSKIILSPDGTSVDCFRYNEAVASGCIVITTTKEDLWYYNNSTAIFINSWDELNKNLIDNILNSDMNSLYSKTMEYYNNTLSEKSVANYIVEKIKKLL